MTMLVKENTFYDQKLGLIHIWNGLDHPSHCSPKKCIPIDFNVIFLLGSSHRNVYKSEQRQGWFHIPHTYAKPNYVSKDVFCNTSIAILHT